MQVQVGLGQDKKDPARLGAHDNTGGAFDPCPHHHAFIHSFIHRRLVARSVTVTGHYYFVLCASDLDTPAPNAVAEPVRDKAKRVQTPTYQRHGMVS